MTPIHSWRSHLVVTPLMPTDSRSALTPDWFAKTGSGFIKTNSSLINLQNWLQGGWS